MIRHEETLMYANLRRMEEELREQGRAQERASLLLQLAVRKFGAEARGELDAVLKGLEDPRRVEAVAAALIESRTAGEFLLRASVA